MDYAPRGLSGVDGADSYALSVDARTGVILRFAERFGGKEFYAAEITEIAFDERFPDDIFRLDLPGLAF